MKILALNVNGDITYCSCTPEQRGTGRCNHIAHQQNGESAAEFIERINSQIKTNDEVKENIKIEDTKEIDQTEIDDIASKIDEIAGEKVTVENWKKVISSLPPEKIDQISKLAFKAAPKFSLPISNEHYEDEAIKNKLYFANLPAYGIGGNKASVEQMFKKAGLTHTLTGNVDVQHSYLEGLTPSEYFARQFVSRDAVINKGVSTSKPGYCIFRDSSVEVLDNNNILVTTKWSDIDVGDQFIDGSYVLEIREWQNKPCYRIKLKQHRELIVSNDHLFYGQIILNGEKITNLEKSKAARYNVQETDEDWICAEDIYEMTSMGALAILNEEYALDFIKPYKNLVPQEVRCITTSTGRYETNGFINHNTARKLFYALSDTQVYEDCGGPYIDVMHCNMPEGHICKKCAALTKGGDKIKEGQFIGGWVSTNLSEALTQLSMKQMHIGSAESSKQLSGSAVIMNTLDGFSSSPIIERAREAKTTEEMRQIIYDGLKEAYENAGLKQDDFNIQMVARKLTSYKRTDDGLVPINPGEKADIVSLVSIGNSGNMFKASQLGSGYKVLTRPKTETIHQDAANQIMN